MDSEPTIIQIDVTKVTGPSLVAVMLVWALFGVLSAQVYLYFRAFPKDQWRIKALVYGVYLLEIAQTILITQTAWNQFATNFGNVAKLDEIGTSWLSLCLVEGIVALLVQSFYVYRIYVLSENEICAAVIMLVSLTSFAGALATTISTQQTGLLSEIFAHKSKTFLETGIWISAGSATDVLIAAAMCYYLRSNASEFRKTQAFISKVIQLTVETGTLTASISVITLILFHLTPQFFVTPLAILAKAYSTTMMALLNNRIKLGIISQSSTWLDVELNNPFPNVQATNGNGAMVFNRGLSTQSPSDLDMMAEERPER